MIQLIVGGKGSGKTKKMIDMINASAKTTPGNIVCIEKSMKLTYDIDHSARLIDVDEYGIDGYDMLYGFIAGVLAGNYDIVEVYLDGVLKLGHHDLDAGRPAAQAGGPHRRQRENGHHRFRRYGGPSRKRKAVRLRARNKRIFQAIRQGRGPRRGLPAFACFLALLRGEKMLDKPYSNAYNRQTTLGSMRMLLDIRRMFSRYDGPVHCEETVSMEGRFPRLYHRGPCARGVLRHCTALCCSWNAACTPRCALNRCLAPCTRVPHTGNLPHPRGRPWQRSGRGCPSRRKAGWIRRNCCIQSWCFMCPACCYAAKIAQGCARSAAAENRVLANMKPAAVRWMKGLLYCNNCCLNESRMRRCLQWQYPRERFQGKTR